MGVAWLRPANFVLLVNLRASELTSAWSEMNAASQIPHIFVRDVFRE
jgi:hypothetical protein